ncbi:hypothetical protein GOICGAJE_03314 [Bacillus sp. MB95]|nr:hypothetical protein [Bacillus sp. MB95]
MGRKVVSMRNTYPILKACQCPLYFFNKKAVDYFLQLRYTSKIF